MPQPALDTPLCFFSASDSSKVLSPSEIEHTSGVREEGGGGGRAKLGIGNNGIIEGHVV